MNRSSLSQRAIALSVSVTSRTSSRVTDWYVHRLDEIDEQLARWSIQRSPRRHADLAFERQRHVDFLVSFDEPPAPRPAVSLSNRPARATLADYAMTSDWRNQLEAVKDELLAVP